MYSTTYNLWTFAWFVHFASLSGWKGLTKFIPRDCLNSTLIYILISLYIWLYLNKKKEIHFKFNILHNTNTDFRVGPSIFLFFDYWNSCITSFISDSISTIGDSSQQTFQFISSFHQLKLLEKYAASCEKYW